ncbi:MAG: hypothetical protein Q4G69_06060 [Planctomycetia bacterium]|nr:hypothetical protein [Planctomycetia bacterium]
MNFPLFFLWMTAFTAEEKKAATRKILQNTAEETIVEVVILAILIAVGLYIILNLRKRIFTPERISSDTLLVQFRQMYEDGELTLDEYRTIKRNLSEELTARSIEVVQNTKNKKNKKDSGNKKSNEEILNSLLRRQNWR